MSAYLESVPARYIAGLVQALTRQGHDCDSVLKAAKLSGAALALPDARIPRERMAALLIGLSLATSRSDLGFEMGRQIDVTAYPLLGQLLRTAGSLGEGLQRLVPYVPLITPSFRVHCEIADGELHMRWQPLRPMPYDMMKMACECILVASCTGLGQLFPSKVVTLTACVPWSAPPHAQRYSELPGLTMRYQAEDTQIGLCLIVPEALVRWTMPRSNSRVWHSAQAACAEELRHLQSMHRWADWVAHVLDVVEDHQPSQAELASLMGIAPRTLARHLEAEGVSYKSMVLDTRHRRACRLLNTSDITVSELGRLLGYNDSANFSRAFKAREGCTPTQYRYSRA